MAVKLFTTLTTPLTKQYSTALRLLCITVLAACLTTTGIVYVFTHEAPFAVFVRSTDTDISPVTTQTNRPAPFPLGVDPLRQEISSTVDIEAYAETYLAYVPRREKLSWLHKLERRLVRSGALQQLASPVSRTLVIWPGDRKEEVVDHFGDILRWTSEERTVFEALVLSTVPTAEDGMFMPGKYILAKDTGPEQAAQVVSARFDEAVLSRYPLSLQNVLPIQDALIVASLLEREAIEFDHMLEISGVIWNRLFADMPLQLDATLQYAKGSKPSTPVWWPSVRPDDKFIDSPFNTYKNTGLPPQPIANPSAIAILAAMNPNQTDCMFYFHHTDGEIFCSTTYEEHTQKLRSLYGRGR